MVTSEQREAFRQALVHARKQRGWSQRRLARELGISQSAVSYWERGKSVPEPANVVDLERVLELRSGTLARRIGYMPYETMRDEAISVLDAITGDPALGPRQREILLALYRQLVAQRRAELAERETGAAPQDDPPRT